MTHPNKLMKPILEHLTFSLACKNGKLNITEQNLLKSYHNSWLCQSQFRDFCEVEFKKEDFESLKIDMGLFANQAVDGLLMFDFSLEEDEEIDDSVGYFSSRIMTVSPVAFYFNDWDEIPSEEYFLWQPIPVTTDYHHSNLRDVQMMVDIANDNFRNYLEDQKIGD
tara:strand:- start:16059 stop:16556 length:498 start_codon:yes stop_codon:yes gene_type:complete